MSDPVVDPEIPEVTKKNEKNQNEVQFSSTRPSPSDAKKSESGSQIIDGGEMISPTESDSEQNPSNLVSETKQDEALGCTEKTISPILWEGNNDIDTVRVDTPENEFSQEAEEESLEESEPKKIVSTNDSNATQPGEIMDPDILTNYDQLFINTRYFLIKSNNYENVVIAKQNNAWATPIGNESRLNKAFHESNNVILIFSVRESGKFQGFARIASPSDCRLKIDWVLPPRMSPDMLSHPFRLDWVTKQELPFGNVSHLTNSWNEGKQVKIGRDGQEIEPVCGQALCRSFPLDSVEVISEIVKKIVPKKPRSADTSRRRNVIDRIGVTSQASSSRRPRDLGFHNPNSVGLLGAATSTRSSVPPLMSTIDLTSAVAAMAAMKSNQSRGSLLPTASPAVDISRFISSSAPGVLPQLIPQPTGTDPVTLSSLLSTHAPAISRIFQQDSSQYSPLTRDRDRRHRSRSSSGGSDRYHRDYHHRDRRRHHDEDSYRYRSRYSREDSRGLHGESRREWRRSRDRSISPSGANAFLNWNYEDYLKEVQRGMNPNLSSLINGVVQPRVHGGSDADRQFDERVNAFLRNITAPSGSDTRYSNDVYRDYERDSRSRSSSSEERYYRRRREHGGHSRERDNHQRSYGDLRRRYEDDVEFEGDTDVRSTGYRRYYEHRRSSHDRSRSRVYHGDDVDDSDDYRDGIRSHHMRYRR